MKEHIGGVHQAEAATILTIRGLRVVLDADLARLYGVTTRRLNEQVGRNRDRFPPDFAFPLSINEKNEVVANCDHLQMIKYTATRTWAFTEHGVLMAAGVLNSKVAIEMSILMVRTFVNLRREVLRYDSIARKLDAMEKRYDANFKAVFDAIRELMRPPEPPSRKIGFRTGGGDVLQGSRGSLKGRGVLKALMEERRRERERQGRVDGLRFQIGTSNTRRV